MIKQLKTIIITAAVLIILVGGVLFVTYSPIFHKVTPSSSAATLSEISLINTDANNITKIKITNITGSYTIVKTSDNTWNIDQIASTLVNSNSVSSIVSSASKLTASKVIEKNASDLNVYGFDIPLATVEFTIDNKIRTMIIGKVSPLGDGYYLMEKGNVDVYLTSTTAKDIFLNSEMYFINTAMLTVDQTNDVPNIQAYTFGGSARTTPINVSKISSSSSDAFGSGYTITQPITINVGADLLSKLNTSLTSISANDCVSLDVSNANLKKYGLDNPIYTFSVTVATKTTTLLFGNTVTDNGSGYIYIRLSDRDAIYKILTSSVPFYNYKLTDLAYPLPFIYMINDVKTITVQSGSSSYKFDLSGADDSLVIKYGDKALTKQYFQHYYQALVGLQIEGETSAPQNPQLLFKITFEFRDAAKKTSVSEFYSMNNGSFCAWNLNGNTSCYTLKSSIDKLITNTQNIANNEDVIVN